MNYTGKNHTFAICAYKESPFLEECIQSLLGQTIPSTIIIVTSTDNAYIQNMAEKYQMVFFSHILNVSVICGSDNNYCRRNRLSQK